MECVPPTIFYHLYFLCISKVLGMLHHWTVRQVLKNTIYFIFMYTFLAFSCFLHQKICVFYHFHFFFGEVSNFHDRILTRNWIGHKKLSVELHVLLLTGTWLPIQHVMSQWCLILVSYRLSTTNHAGMSLQCHNWYINESNLFEILFPTRTNNWYWPIGVAVTKYLNMKHETKYMRLNTLAGCKCFNWYLNETKAFKMP